MLGMNDTSHATTVHYFISKYDLPGVTFCHGLKDFKILLKSLTFDSYHCPFSAKQCCYGEEKTLERLTTV